MIIDVAGLKLNYEVSGEGNPILLLHGWGGQIDSFKPVFDYFSKSNKVYAIDFPGFGKSDIPKEVWGVKDYAEMLNELLEKLNITKIDIIAHSFGGRVSIIFSSMYPGKVNKLVLVNSGGLISKKSFKYYLKIYSFKLAKKVYLLFIPGDKREEALNKLYTKFGSSDFKSAGEMRKIFTKVINEDLKEYLSTIKASTLLVWGENDKETPVYFGEIMKKEIPDSGLIVFKDAGHFSYLDKFNDFCIIVSNFFNNK